MLRTCWRQQTVKKMTDNCLQWHQIHNQSQQSMTVWSHNARLCQSFPFMTRDVPDKDFSLSDQKWIIPDTGYWRKDRKTYWQLSWVDLLNYSSTPSEWALSSLGTVLVWLGHPDSCVGGVTSFTFELVMSWFESRVQQRSQLTLITK